MEACCTLGMLTQQQADSLGDAGLTAYNHNLDTSPEFYGHIITTRTYRDRLDTLARVRQAGITVCCGGIIGMGEDRQVRYRMLQQLAALDPHPESVPINMLVRVDGTPLAELAPEDPLEMIRTIATARILMPASFVRLPPAVCRSATKRKRYAFAGANSVFLGDKLLTTPNPGASHDEASQSLRYVSRPDPVPAATVGATSRLSASTFPRLAAALCCVHSWCGMSCSIESWCSRVVAMVRSGRGRPRGRGYLRMMIDAAGDHAWRSRCHNFSCRNCGTRLECGCDRQAVGQELTFT